MIEKELKDISWLVDEPVYRQDSALSYSTLAKYEREGYDKLESLFEHISTPSLIEGSMVDCLITGSQEEFDEQFYVTGFPSIGDKEQQVVNYLFQQYGEHYKLMAELPTTYIVEAANAFEFQKNWKEETRVRVLIERGHNYYELKSVAGDRIIVSMETFYKIQAMVKALKESPATRGYFAEDDLDSPVRRYYQLKFKATLNDVDYRCMADEIIVDYSAKKIYPIDLKTSGKKEWHFEDSFEQWQYMIQARLYWRIIKANLMNDLFFKDFSLEDYKFIVVNKDSLTPLVWEFPLTTSYGTLIDEKGSEFRDPFEIGKELQSYLDNKPNVPNGINIDGVNTIKCLKIKPQ